MSRQPRWFAEGLAEYLETVSYDPSRAAAMQEKSGLSFFPIWTALVWPTRRSQYLRSLRFNAIHAVVPLVSVTIDGRHPLTEADVLGLRAMLYMALRQSSRRTPAESEALAREAIEASFRQDPASFWAHQVAYAYFGTLPDSVATAKRAIRGHTDEWEAWMWYGDALTHGPADLEEARQALIQSSRLAGERPTPLVHASMLEASAGRWDAAFDLAARAVRLPPGGVDTALAFVTAASHVGRCGEAGAVEQELKSQLTGVPDDVSRTLEQDDQACIEAARRGTSPAAATPPAETPRAFSPQRPAGETEARAQRSDTAAGAGGLEGDDSARYARAQGMFRAGAVPAARDGAAALREVPQRGRGAGLPLPAGDRAPAR